MSGLGQFERSWVGALERRSRTEWATGPISRISARLDASSSRLAVIFLLTSGAAAIGDRGSAARGPMNWFAWTLRWRGVDSNFEFLDAFVRSASSSDLLERAFWR
jgi:hypothetical protein